MKYSFTCTHERFQKGRFLDPEQGERKISQLFGYILVYQITSTVNKLLYRYFPAPQTTQSNPCMKLGWNIRKRRNTPLRFWQRWMNKRRLSTYIFLSTKINMWDDSKWLTSAQENLKKFVMGQTFSVLRGSWHLKKVPTYENCQQNITAQPTGRATKEEGGNLKKLNFLAYIPECESKENKAQQFSNFWKALNCNTKL